MESKPLLTGKKVLITSFSYANFGGAELNAVEFADQAVALGATPYFFSYDIDGPLARYINQRFQTQVMTDDVNLLAEIENELGYMQLDITDYDYIWVGANMLPISIIKQINTAKILPKFIFIHMSQLVGFPLDAPLLPEFERMIASKVLSISNRATEECVYRVLGKDIPLTMWPNPAPTEFRHLKKRRGDLKKIAVISSSHPTDEIMEIQKEVERQGIKIDYIGRFNNNVKAVNASFYDEYDLIIGIGKNVKYSLVSGVPIYIYGRFGGGGYINSNNYNRNDEHNFSGRGFTKKKASQIAKEIVEQYPAALRFHEKNREKYIKEYSIDVITENLFYELEHMESKKISFSEEYINWLVSMQINFMQNMKRFGGLRGMEPRLEQLESLSQQQQSKIQELYSSHSWKLTRPLRSMVGLAKKMTSKR